MSLRLSAELTQAVLSEMARAENPRTRELLQALVRHLHDFVTEVRLSEAEFQQALGTIARLGQATHASHNEVALASGSPCTTKVQRGARVKLPSHRSSSSPSAWACGSARPASPAYWCRSET